METNNFSEQPFQNFSREKSARRAEYIMLSERLFAEGAKQFSEEEQCRLAALREEFPDMKRQYDELSATAMRVAEHVRSRAAEYTDESERAASLENRIMAKLYPTTERPATEKTQQVRPAVRLVLLYGKYARSIVRVAAVFVVGAVAGHFLRFPEFRSVVVQNGDDVASSSDGVFRPVANISDVSGDRDRVRRAEMQSFFRDAHLLMLGIMAMNAECGVPNPDMLASQRERCVELLARSSRIQSELPPHERKRLMHVIGEIESALAEVAEVHPATCNASAIRNMQKHADYALCEVSGILTEGQSR